MKNTSIILRPDEMKFGENGVEPFFWPITLEEQQDVCNDFVVSLLSYIRKKDVHKNKDAETVFLIASMLVTSFSSLFSSKAFLERTTEKGPFNNSFIDSLNEGKAPLPFGYVKNLDKVFLSYPLWKIPLRTIKTFFDKNRLSYKHTLFINKNKDIPCCSDSPFIRKVAKNNKEYNVVGSRLEDWVDIRPNLNIETSPNVSNETISDLCEIAKDCCKKKNVVFNEIMTEFFIYTIKSLSMHSIHQLNYIEKRKKKLPKRFWVGTTGILWSRILAWAIMKNGGEVTGFDHGTGNFWLDSLGSQLIEFNYINNFVTFSKIKEQKNCIKQKLAGVVSHKCKLSSAFFTNKKEQKRTQLNFSNDVKTAMYVSTIYTGNFVHFAMMSDIVYVDWQFRLLSFLNKQKIKILHKPHPESYCPLPKSFSEKFNTTVLDGRFGDHISKADVLIYDYPLTTTFSEGLRAGYPIVLIDFGVANLTNEVKSLLEKRVEIVNGWFDDKNKAHIDWNELKKAINTAHQKTSNNEFIQKYFPVDVV